MTLLQYETIPIHETNEPLVDLSTYPFIIEPAYYQQGLSDDPVVWIRLGVATMLLAAQNQFEGNYRFKIWDGYRPRDVQAKLYETLWNQLARQHPGLSPKQLHQQTQQYIHPAFDPQHVPPHTTGGTVDLTLVDKTGTALPMGTSFDHFGPESASDYFEATGTDYTIRNNRRTLIQAMKSAGFTVHQNEWWHFDYGNQAWAAGSGQPAARYGEVSR